MGIHHLSDCASKIQMASHLCLVKVAFLFFYIFLSLQISLGQTISEDRLLIYHAEAIYRSGKYLDEAVQLYKKAFAQKVIDGAQVLDAITCATNVRDTASVILFMKCGLAMGMKMADYEKLWEHLGNGLSFESISETIDPGPFIAQYKSTLIPSLIDQLKAMSERDQAYRSEDNENQELQRKNDSLNWQTLKEITLVGGRLPRYSEIGFEGTEFLNIIFYHMDKNEIEWFLPYIIENIRLNESTLSHVILYQLDRIGMSEGLLYTISSDVKLKAVGPRKKMKNNYWCQSFGEWFDEMGRDGKYYITPLDPGIDLAEINRIRSLFLLDDIENRNLRKPWAFVASIEEFETQVTD